MHAFIVLAHTDPTMCHRLVSTLADHGRVHLHVNAVVDPRPFRPAAELSTVLTPPVEVHWGGWSLCEATFKLAAAALEDPEVEQITWLSGQHYPLMDPAAIVAVPPADHIRIHHAPDAELGKAEWRFRSRFIDTFPPGSRRDVLANGIIRRLPQLQYEKILGPHQLYAGTAWWSLTRRTVTEMLQWLDDNPDITRYFGKLCVPDESVFHTAVGAVLAERARREGLAQADPTRMTLGATTYVRWNGGRHPEPLDADSIRQAAQDGWWFARKFDSSRPDLIEAAEQPWRRGASSAETPHTPRGSGLAS